MTRFTDKTVIITGAAGGIGRAAALRFATEGASVVAVDLDEAAARATVDAVTEAGGTAIAVGADVSERADADRYVASAVDAFGGVDVLCNNAGIEGTVAPLDAYPDETFAAVLDVNVRGVWLGMACVADALRARGGGAIVNTASNAGLMGTPNMIAYGASKHAVIGMTKTAALEFGPVGIRVNAVCPSPIETRMMRSIEAGMSPVDPDRTKKAIETGNPMGRYGTPDEVAALITFLASDEASYVNGGIYTVDGGHQAQ